jgi:cell wall-associated NlpC family hydrolase
MTRNRTISQRRRSASSSVIVAAAMTALLSLGVADHASATSARTSSVDVAAAASSALDALAVWNRTGAVTDYVAYTQARAVAAGTAAAALGVSRSGLMSEWAEADIDKQHVVLAAVSQVGVPYRSRMSSEGVGFDCSGLLLYAFEQAGVEIPRVSRDQFRASDEIGPLQAEPGDLVFYPGHIGLYVGLGLMVHAPQSGQDVEIRSLFDRSLRFGDLIAAESDQLAEQSTAAAASTASVIRES